MARPLPPAPRRPAFLPWLLTPPDAKGHRKARCVFSAKPSRHTMHIRDGRFVISAEDGVAIFPLDASPESASSSLRTHLPPYPDEIESRLEGATGIVSGGGTILVYAFGYYSYGLTVALLRPGDTAWTVVQKNVCICRRDRGHCCMPYRDDKIVLCHESSWLLMSVQTEAGINYHRMNKVLEEPGMKTDSSYIVESRGELLWVLVQVRTESSYCKVCVSGIDSLLSVLSVSVYTLREEERREPLWVKMDSQNFADRIFFLGRPSSFVVDSARLGMKGGCAYFVKKSMLYAKIWSKSALDRGRLFRYSFHDDKSEVLGQLPQNWDNEAYTWIMPQPTIAPTEEIRGRLGTLDPKPPGPQKKFGVYFRIYVGNLPPKKVDSYQLRQFFSKHGKVADARVMCHRGSEHSRGFGFVTMAITEDDEPAHAITKLHGQSMDGCSLRVKLADQETWSRT